ncbi:S-adenosyl-L-methionine-dependent methyltransferase [Paraphysoderma sedebokerense]|nr:S-adenosyl-L-methionine-dependent methyltransferase [Paraphysoderma sedebokerense]
MTEQYAILTPPSAAKSLKTLLESLNHFSKAQQIIKVSSDHPISHDLTRLLVKSSNNKNDLCLIPIYLNEKKLEEFTETIHNHIKSRNIEIPFSIADIKLYPDLSANFFHSKHNLRSPIEVLRHSLIDFIDAKQSRIDSGSEKSRLNWKELIKNGKLALPNKWELYDDFLLLMDTAFMGENWEEFFSVFFEHGDHEHMISSPMSAISHPTIPFISSSDANSQNLYTTYNSISKDSDEVFIALPSQTIEFYQLVAKAFRVGHVARKTVIPADDALRRPKITVLYGDKWGSHFFRNDFTATFFTRTLQNSVIYTWSPLFTMFSAGNISEKQRVAKFPAENEIIVDLYAGIGYWVFPFIIWCKAKLVHACEWNEWSVEGLRRGCDLNAIDWTWGEQWSETGDSDQTPTVSSEPNKRNVKGAQSISKSKRKLKLTGKVVIHRGPNHRSLQAFESTADRVQLGLIPSSEQGYELAVRSLDPLKGGWIHVHGNVVEGRESHWCDDLVLRFKNIFKDIRGSQWKIEIVWLERVKSFKPRVWHCVADMKCTPI